MKISFFFALFFVFHFSNGFTLREVLARFSEMRDNFMKTLSEVTDKAAQNIANNDSKSVNATETDSVDYIAPFVEAFENASANATQAITDATDDYFVPAVEAFENASANATQAIANAAEEVAESYGDEEKHAQDFVHYVAPFAEAFDASANATQAAADAAEEVAADFVEQASAYFP